MTYHFRMDFFHCEVCGSKVKRYNWLNHLQTKTHKRKAKDEDLADLAGVLDWNQCGKCEAHRSLDMFKEGNETCNRCLDRNKRWAEKNREREKKKRDEQKEEKKECNQEYAMRETDCLTCGCRVRKCKWRRHILSNKHLVCAGHTGCWDGVAGVVS